MMAPRRPHLRNRKKIKAPRRFEDEHNTASPRQESHQETDESSELEEEIYESPNPRKPKSRRPAYCGEVIEFNPNLPPAAFPTLDHPDYVHNGGTVTVDLESQFPGLQSPEPRLSGFEWINPDALGSNCRTKEMDRTEDDPTMRSATADLTHSTSQSFSQNSMTVQKQTQGSMLSSMYGESTDNGPRNPIWVSNMARMEEAGRMSDLDRIMLEMETSDEDASDEENTAARSSKLARTASIPEFPAWDDLTVAHKLDLADAITEIYPALTQVIHQLRLSSSQEEELVELLNQRQDRTAREEANQQRLQEQTNEILLQGRSLSQSTFRQMVEENLYKHIHENDHIQTNLMELKKARAYLRYCGFDPSLADAGWDVSSISNVVGSIDPGPVQSRPEAGISNIAAQTLPGPSEGPFSRRPSLFTSSLEDSYPSDPHSGLLQKQAEGVLSQHRPSPAHALIAQHSPAAPLSKIPIQSYRINPGSQVGDLRSKDQGRLRIPQPSLSALQARSNASTNIDQRTIYKKLLKASGTSSLPPSLDEGTALPVALNSVAPKVLLPAKDNHKRQSSANAKAEAEALAPKEPRGIDKNRNPVDKKKGKKKAA